MQFQDIVGQHEAKNALLHAVHAGRLPHALMLLGQEGTGALPLAIALSAYLLCENRSETDSCGQCPGCRKVNRLEHPDLHFSFPAIRPESASADKSYSSNDWRPGFRKFLKAHPYGSTFDWLQSIQAGNKQGNITAKECREIIEQLSFKSYEGGARILIMWRPEYLDKEGNILLKLIEEPPAGAYIFFVAAETEKVLATILSRVQTVRLVPATTEVLTQSLLEKEDTDDPRIAAQAAIRAGGNYGEALRMLEGTDKDLFPEFRNWFNAIFRNIGYQFAPFAETMNKDGRERIKDFLEYALHLLEATLRRYYMPDTMPAFPVEEAAFITKLAAQKGINAGSLAAMCAAISEAHTRIGRNANARIILHGLSIQVVRIVQGRAAVMA